LTKPGQSTKVASSKYKVQFDTEKVRTWVLPLLRRIEAGDYPAKAGRIIGLSRQHVGYYMKKLEECGLIHREKRSNVVFYELTSAGTNLLKSCEGRVFPGELHRLDKCQVAFLIAREGVYPEGNFKRVEMVNWTALLGLELGVKVRHTSKSWIVHVPVIRGRNPGEVYGLAMNLANRVAVALGKKYGVALCEGKFVGGEMAVEDPVAKMFGRYFTVRTKQRKIDHSLGEGELENLGKDAVIDYLQMPEKVKKIERDVERLAYNVVKLTEALGGLSDLEDPKRLAEGQRRLGDYVR
jgi:DNA-binding transcriptional ArsR family regulator